MHPIPSPAPTGEYFKSWDTNPELGKIYRRGNEFCIDALIMNAKGLHLRPSAALAEAATQYPETRVILEAGSNALEIRKQMDIVSCGVLPGTRITFAAKGSHAEEVLNKLYQRIQDINRRTYDTPEDEEEP